MTRKTRLKEAIMYSCLHVLKKQKTMKRLITLAILTIILADSCTISYKFNGASIDYSKIKSITIAEFPNNAALVYPPLTTKFNDELNNIYASQTRLNIVSAGGDLDISGAITGYTLVPLSVGANALAAENRLTLTVKVHFINNITGEETDNSYSANRTFPSTSTLNDVQDALIDEMIEEIIDQIFNGTVANW